MNRETPLIEFRNVSKSYGAGPAVDQLNLAIYPGEFFVLVGASGSGKSTTLRMINALEEPSAGDVYFNGRRIKDYHLRPLRHRMGYVLQQIALFPTMTVAENITLMPELLGWSRPRRCARLRELLALVDLDPELYQRRYPAELSGGEQQRVGILRAIAAEPDILLMDEPFSALDPLARAALQETVALIHKKLGTTMVFVTHDMNEALLLADRIAVMHQGRLLQVAPPAEIQQRPADEQVRALFSGTQNDAATVIAQWEMLAPAERAQVLQHCRRNHP